MSFANDEANMNTSGIVRSAMDELRDIVDRQDRAVAVKKRKEVKGDFVNTRYVNIFIRNSKGELYIPYRRDDLDRWPSSPDFAVGGGVEAGEDYLDAALRETQEEIGLELGASDLELLAYVSPYKFPIACFMKIYEYQCDDISLVSEEYKSAQWMEVSELMVLLAANELPVKTDLLPVLRLCYGSLKDMDRKLLEPSA